VYENMKGEFYIVLLLSKLKQRGLSENIT